MATKPLGCKTGLDSGKWVMGQE